jgi:hypothetical protein
MSRSLLYAALKIIGCPEKRTPLAAQRQLADSSLSCRQDRSTRQSFGAKASQGDQAAKTRSVAKIGREFNVCQTQQMRHRRISLYDLDRYAPGLKSGRSPVDHLTMALIFQSGARQRCPWKARQLKHDSARLKAITLSAKQSGRKPQAFRAQSKRVDGDAAWYNGFFERRWKVSVFAPKSELFIFAPESVKNEQAASRRSKETSTVFGL